MEKTKLQQFASRHGVQAVYQDALGKRRKASPAAIEAALQAMGIDPAQAAAPEAYRRELAEPVKVAWGNAKPRVTVRLRENARALRYALRTEAGQTYETNLRPSDLDDARRLASGRLQGDIVLPRLEFGYHTLHTFSEGEQAETLIICAPPKAYAGYRGMREWGVFLPLYALRSEGDWGAGDFTSLKRLAEWTGLLGGNGVGILPVLSAFLRKPFEPSPYAPVSRLFWNEVFIDPRAVPEFGGCTEAQNLFDSRSFQDELAAARRASQVDYRTLVRMKRPILELLEASFFTDTQNESRRKAFDAFVRNQPEAEEYARFQACVEQKAAPWPAWDDASLTDLQPPDYSDSAYRYHLYVQWVAEDQLSDAAKAARNAGRGLYLDLPLGVSYDGFDVWKYRHLFALDAATGAPPDPFFTKGQNWGFPPLRPDALRRDRYAYFIRFVQKHMAHAGMLRIDHVMSLHRLFWIPKGFDAEDGVYVHYEADEMYAILSLESHRHDCCIVGENLGTVPRYINSTLERRGIMRMYILQYETGPNSPPNEPGENVLAALNTHDMPPFRAFWKASDVDDRVDLGILNAEAADDEKSNRRKTRDQITKTIGLSRDAAPDDVTTASLQWLARSKAKFVLVNLEDLWGEELPQNTPGTVEERPNWVRRAKLSFEDIQNNRGLRSLLSSIDDYRKQQNTPKHGDQSDQGKANHA